MGQLEGTRALHDLVIRGGMLIDGTGDPARRADVAVDDGIISEVGLAVGPGAREIDATDLLVTPGFVDMHTHYDAQVTWDPYLTPSSWHGCTTVVMGNCGVGFAPAAPDRHDWLIRLMEGVEDIPGAAMTEGIQWGWESFPEFLDTIEARPTAIDFAAQVPHGAVRGYVMGERGANNEDATPDDIAAMKKIVREALDAGAVGFSTSRTLLHKSIDGVPVPGTFAAQDEIFGIGEALDEAGRGVYQLAVDHLDVPGSYDWMEELSRKTGRTVMFTLTQTDFAPALWRDLLARLEDSAAEGVEILGQVAGRAIGVMMNWRITAHPFARHPSFMEVADLPWPELLALLRTPEFKDRLLNETGENLEPFEMLITQSFDKMYLLEGGIDYEPHPDQSIAARARRMGRRPEEIAYEAMLEDDGTAMLYFPLFNYSNGDLEHLREMHLHPRTRMGLSDAGAHCGAVCDGGMPTFMLTHWTRDRSRGERLPLEHIIQRQTRDTARTYGFFDRGVVAPGYKADLNVIDYDALQFEQPQVVFDLPAGGRRLVQRAQGYASTIVSGVEVVRNGEPTGEFPGRLIRGTQPAPVQPAEV